MKTRSRVLTLLIVAALAGLGAWLIVSTAEEPTPPDPEVAHRDETPILPPPVLQGREPVPGGEIKPPVHVVEEAGITLTVHVLDEARGRAIEDAVVHVAQGEGEPRVLKTNEAGMATIPDLQAGEAYVVVRASGFVRAEAHPDLTGPDPTVLELRLESGVVLEGTVVEARTGLAIAGASVVVTPGGSLDGWMEMSVASPFGGALTDERGRFVVRGVAPEVLLTARATARGYGTASQSMRLAPASDAPTTVVLRLPPAAVLTGLVRRPDGQVAAQARVYAVPADAPDMLLADPETQCVSNGRPFRSLRGITGDDGAYRIEGLEVGALYTVFAALEGHGRSALKKSVMATEEDPRPRVDLVLQGAASLTVRVWSPEGEPQEEGRVTVFGDGFPLQLALQSPGVFAVREPPPGTYTLRVVCVGTVRQEQTVEIAVAEQKEVEIRLERGFVLTGVLVDDTGRPVTGQKLWVSRHWQQSGKYPPSEGSAVTDDEGRFRIGGLRDGPHALNLVLGRHIVPDDLRVEPPAADLRVVVLRRASLIARLQLPPGFAPPDRVGIRVGRKEDGGYGESGHSAPFNESELRFEDLAPGPVRVCIQIEGLLEVTRELTLEPGEVADLGTVALEAGFTLEGRVVDKGDRPLAGARVTAGQVWTATHREVVAGADGRFVLPTLSRGANEIRVVHPGYLPRTAEVVMPEEASGRSFVLDKGCLVTVRVTEAGGTPAPARLVRWRPASAPKGAEAEDFEETDAKGRFQVRLAGGRWTFDVLDDEWHAVTSTDLELTEGGSVEVDLVLTR